MGPEGMEWSQPLKCSVLETASYLSFLNLFFRSCPVFLLMSSSLIAVTQPRNLSHFWLLQLSPPTCPVPLIYHPSFFFHSHTAYLGSRLSFRLSHCWFVLHTDIDCVVSLSWCCCWSKIIFGSPLPMNDILKFSRLLMIYSICSLM